MTVRRARSARIGGVLALVALLGGLGLGTCAPVAAQAPPPAPSGLLLVAQTAWVVEDQPFALDLRTRAPLPEDGTLELTLYGAATSREVLARGPVDPAALGPVRDLLSVPVAIVPRGRDGRYRLRIATDGSGTGLQVDDPGVYPLTVAIGRPDGTTGASLTTFLVRPPEDAAATPLRTAVILPLHAAPSYGPDGVAALDDRTRALLEVRSDVLRRYRDLALTVVPTPETLEATDEVDQGLARQVRAALADRHVVGGPYVRIDLAAWAAESSLGADLDEQFDVGERVLERVLGRTVDRRTWAGFGNPTPAALDALADVGIDRAVVGADAVTGPVTPIDEPVVVTGGTGQELPAMLSDPALRAESQGTTDAVLAAYRTLAELAFLAATPEDGGGAVTGTDDGVVVDLPAGRPLAPGFLDTLFRVLDRPGGPLRAVTLAQLFELDPAGDPGPEPGPVVTGVPTAGSDLSAYAVRLDATRQDVAGFASFAGRLDPLTADLDRRLLVSGAADLVDNQRNEYLGAARAAIGEQAAAVAITDGAKVTLTSREGDIPVTIHNDTGSPVEVDLLFDSDNRLDFPDGARRRLLLAEGANRIDVPVVARTSGSFPLRITATSPDGELTVGRATITVRSTAVSGVGLVLSIGAGLVLVLWWGRHWHTTRRNRHLVSAGDAAGNPEAPTGV